jgi:hypothetical protein
LLWNPTEFYIIGFTNKIKQINAREMLGFWGGGGGGKEHLYAVYLNTPLITLDIFCSATK